MQWCMFFYRLSIGDQIIEVNGCSLVGVTQNFAASILRNTSGIVKYAVLCIV